MMSNPKGEKTLVLVLERGNVTRLTAKRPITIPASNMNLKDFKGVKEIVIAFYETPEQAIAEMSSAISDKTQIKFGDYGEQK
jgi:hypothetical protein